jgi:hypothetical protein
MSETAAIPASASAGPVPAVWDEIKTMIGSLSGEFKDLAKRVKDLEEKRVNPNNEYVQLDVLLLMNTLS